MAIPDELQPIAESQQDLYANLWVNGEDTGVTISIRDEMINISGLQPELPPFLHVWPGGAEYSQDDETWRVEEDEGAQIYLLFHPRLALKQGDQFRRLEDNIWKFQYSARPLLPPSLIEDLSSELERPGEIRVIQGNIVHFKTIGIKPDPEEVELRFIINESSL
jgi:hypothetical protein